MKISKNSLLDLTRSLLEGGFGYRGQSYHPRQPAGSPRRYPATKLGRKSNKWLNSIDYDYDSNYSAGMHIDRREKFIKDIVYESEDLIVVVPRTTDNSMYWGTNTKWQISIKSAYNSFLPKILNSKKEIFFAFFLKKSSRNAMYVEIRDNFLSENFIFDSKDNNVSFEDLDRFCGDKYDDAYDAIFDRINSFGGIHPVKKMIIDLSKTNNENDALLLFEKIAGTYKYIYDSFDHTDAIQHNSIVEFILRIPEASPWSLYAVASPKLNPDTLVKIVSRKNVLDATIDKLIYRRREIPFELVDAILDNENVYEYQKNRLRSRISLPAQKSLLNRQDVTPQRLERAAESDGREEIRRIVAGNELSPDRILDKMRRSELDRENDIAASTLEKKSRTRSSNTENMSEIPPEENGNFKKNVTSSHQSEEERKRSQERVKEAEAQLEAEREKYRQEKERIRKERWLKTWTEKVRLKNKERRAMYGIPD